MTASTIERTDEFTSFHEILESRILAGMPDAFEENLTPADAEMLLELNTRNRSVHSTVTSLYSSDMVTGRWRYAAEPLKFDSEGTLLDGQHRLLALASLAKTHPDTIIKFLIVTGLDSKAQEVMDQGARRTAGDNLGMAGIKHSNDIAAAARTYILWTEGRIFLASLAGAGKVGNTEAQSWVLAHPDFVDDVTFAIKHKKSIDVSPRIYATAYSRFKAIDEQAANDFLTQLATGANLYEGHPILTLRDRLARIRRDKTKTSDRDYLAFLILAWNAYRTGNTMYKFQRPRGASWSKSNYPQPI